MNINDICTLWTTTLIWCKVWHYTTPYFLFPITSTQQIFVRLLSIETTIRGWKDDWFEHENETFNWHCLVFICSELRLGEWEDTISLRPQQNLWHTTQTLHTSLRRKTHRQRYRHSRTSRYEMGNAYNWLKPTSKSSLQIVCKLALKLQHWKLTRSRYLTDQHFEFVGDWVSKNSQKLAASATHRAVLRLKNLTALI